MYLSVATIVTSNVTGGNKLLFEHMQQSLYILQW